MREPIIDRHSEMGVIEEVHEELDADITLSEFRDAVEEKVEDMGDLADEETAATLVAYELEDDRIKPIGDIDAELAEVKFLGKVREVGELRTFEREDDEPGHVINVEVVDETGSVRVAFWDEQARAIEREGIEPGAVLRIRGYPRDGSLGLEVSAQQAEVDEDADVDVDLEGAQSIAELAAGQAGRTVQGQVLETEDVRTFERDDGSEGQVSNVVIGDETGAVRATLWDDRAAQVAEVAEGDVIELRDGSVRERDGQVEYHLGDRGALEAIDAEVMFVPTVTPIADLEEDDTADIAGIVRSSDGIRTFDRDDGSTGKVKNIRLQDETGDIRVAIWGDRADRDLGPGDPVWFGDVQIQDGWQDELEASVNWRSSMAEIDRAALDEIDTTPSSSSPPSGDEGTPGLDSFDTTDEPTSKANEEEPAEPEETTFTGTVVQTGSPIILDDGTDTVRVDTSESVTLGEELTVQGQRQADRIDAERIDRPDGKR